MPSSQSDESNSLIEAPSSQVCQIDTRDYRSIYNSQPIAQLHTHAFDSLEVYAHQLLPKAALRSSKVGAVLPPHLPIYSEQAFGPVKTSCLSDIVHSF